MEQSGFTFPDLGDTLFMLGQQPIRVADMLLAAAVVLALLALMLASSLMRARAERKRLEEAARTEHVALESQLGMLLKTQAEMTGRMQTMAEVFGNRQADLARVLGERMDGMGHKINQSMTQTTRDTSETLRTLHERLATIDTAQRNITELSRGVVELQSILSDKQTRGAFGQGRMEAIVQDALPRGSYSFQHTLRNGRRPDCVIFLPNDAPSLVVDAKFPLEAWRSLRDAEDERDRKAAGQALRQHVGKHVSDIRERYFIAGETHDTAFMFVPSESIFADLHEQFEDVVQKAARARVVIVSPSLLTLSIQVVQSILRDARLREQAHLIQDEVTRLVEDIVRLDQRVEKLQTHFIQTGKDIEMIRTSTTKIVKRGDRIGDLDMAERPAGRNLEDSRQAAGSERSAAGSERSAAGSERSAAGSESSAACNERMRAEPAAETAHDRAQSRLRFGVNERP